MRRARAARNTRRGSWIRPGSDTLNGVQEDKHYKVASEMGLAGRALPPDSLTEEARALTGTIAADNSRTLAHGKAAVDLVSKTTIGQGLHHELVANGATLASEDYEVDLTAFAERRALNFRHRLPAESPDGRHLKRAASLER